MINLTIIKFKQQLFVDPNVKWFERQMRLSRKKRDLIDDTIENDSENAKLTIKPNFNDESWADTWYYVRHQTAGKTDMNITAAWKFGVTGKNITISIIDDGLEHTHMDLIGNYDSTISYDYCENDADPTPRYANENRHGTRCAGVASATANNSNCSVGAAYNSRIGGIRILDSVNCLDINDGVEASALSHNHLNLDIYSASWGPDDDGKQVDGPGPLARKALKNGAKNGRNGKGSLYVWSTGNGGTFADSCACDGYVNSIYTIGIGSVTEFNGIPQYLEPCAAVHAVTYSSDLNGYPKRVFTTDLNNKCTNDHSGTSASAPMAAGIIALILEANPTLTWRDVMFITILASNTKGLKDNNLIRNNVGLTVSNYFGFGLMNAGRMVEFALSWINVPEMKTCSTLGSKFSPYTFFYYII